MGAKIVKKIVYAPGTWIKVLIDGCKLLMIGNQVVPRMEEPILISDCETFEEAKAGLAAMIATAQLVGGEVYSYMQVIA